MSEISKSIVQSVDFISQVYTECKALSQVLREKLSELINNENVAKNHAVDDTTRNAWINAYQEDDSGGLYHSYASSLPLLTRKSKQENIAHLFFQISLAGDGTPSEAAVIHIGLWAHAISFSDDYYVGFPLHNKDEMPPKLIDDTLMMWTYDGDNMESTEWLYSIDLCALNTPDDIETKIINPVKHLLLTVEPTPKDEFHAWNLKLSGLLKYVPIEGDPGLFSVSLCE